MDLIKKVTSEQRLQGDERVGKDIPGKKRDAGGGSAVVCLVCLRNSKAAR